MPNPDKVTLLRLKANVKMLIRQNNLKGFVTLGVRRITGFTIKTHKEAEFQPGWQRYVEGLRLAGIEMVGLRVGFDYNSQVYTDLIKFK